MLKPSDPIDDSLSIGGNAESQLIDFWQFAPSAPSLVNVSIETTSSGLGAAFTQLNIGATTGDECFFVDSGSCTASISFNPALGLSLSLNLGVTAQCLVTFVEGGGSCFSSANYLGTSFISSVSFTDAEGNPIDLSFTTQSGLTYPMTQVVGVAEPATFTLLGIGFAGIGFARRRKLNEHRATTNANGSFRWAVLFWRPALVRVRVCNAATLGA